MRFRSGGALQNAMSLANHLLNMLKMRSDRRVIGHHLQIICSRFYDAERLSQVVNQIYHQTRLFIVWSEFVAFFRVPT